MSHGYHCPTCASALQQMTRSLDFFCRSCYTSLIVIDQEWAQLMGVNDKVPQLIPVARCRSVRGTEPLNRPTQTAPLGAIAS